ncbi:hypothetical protein FJZ31_06035 [Candidatus Poribacteria bacterium]|nr:hypothetical protein [Candidatus Poribacteria bacterium]
MFQQLFQRISNFFFACFIFIILASVALIISPGYVQAQTQWLEYQGKPALDLAPAGPWDAGLVFLPCVIKDGNTLKMWYHGADKSQIFGSEGQIGYAWSQDGINWTRHPAPVLSKRPGQWDGGDIIGAEVIKDGNTFRLWYSATPAGVTGPNGSAIGYATSVDGINWDRQSSPVIQRGPAGEWDSDLIAPSAVIKEGNTFKMWFDGSMGNFPSPRTAMVGYATSTDGIHWTKYNDPATTAPPFQFSDPVLQTGAPGAFDAPNIHTPSVLKTASGYEMWYTGYGDLGQIGYATSKDGIHWTKYSGNPVLRVPGAVASEFMAPSVILDAGQYRMWYCDFQVDYPFASFIRYATAGDQGTVISTVDKRGKLTTTWGTVKSKL